MHYLPLPYLKELFVAPLKEIKRTSDQFLEMLELMLNKRRENYIPPYGGGA
jgi:hypothetical protein